MPYTTNNTDRLATCCPLGSNISTQCKGRKENEKNSEGDAQGERLTYFTIYVVTLQPKSCLYIPHPSTRAAMATVTT